MEEKGVQVEQQNKKNNIANKFSERENKGKIEDILNPNIPVYDNSANTSKRVLIPDRQVESYRYMYQTRILEGVILILITCDVRLSFLTSCLKRLKTCRIR